MLVEYGAMIDVEEVENRGVVSGFVVERAEVGGCCAVRGVVLARGLLTAWLPELELLMLELDPVGVPLPEVLGWVRASRIHACFSPSSGVMRSLASQRKHPSKKSKNNLHNRKKTRR